MNLDGACSSWRVPSSLVKERVQGRYEAMVRDALSEVGFPGVELFIEVMPDEVEAPCDLLESLMPASQSDTSDMSPAMLALEPMPTRTAADLNPRYTFEAFVTGTSNRFAHAAALSRRRDARRGRTTRCSSTAAPGLGKTHLLQAIGHYVQRELRRTTGSATSRPRRS